MDEIEKSLMDGKNAEMIDFTFSSADADMPVEDENMQSRFKSPVVWMSAIAQIVLIIDCIYGICVNGWDVSVGEKIGLAVISLLTMFGILNSPTSKGAF